MLNSMHYTTVLDELAYGPISELNRQSILDIFSGDVGDNNVVNIELPVVYLQHVRQMAELEQEEARRKEKKKRQVRACLMIALMILLMILNYYGIIKIIRDVEVNSGLQCFIEQLHYML